MDRDIWIGVYGYLYYIRRGYLRGKRLGYKKVFKKRKLIDIYMKCGYDIINIYFYCVIDMYIF